MGTSEGVLGRVTSRERKGNQQPTRGNPTIAPSPLSAICGRSGPVRPDPHLTWTMLHSLSSEPSKVSEPDAKPPDFGQPSRLRCYLLSATVLLLWSFTQTPCPKEPPGLENADHKGINGAR